MVAVTFTAYNTQSKHRAEYRPRPSAHGLSEAPSPSSPKRAGGVMSLSGHVLHLSNVVKHAARLNEFIIGGGKTENQGQKDRENLF